MNKEGRRLVKWLGERGWSILNDGVKGDEEGNWTYTRGRGESEINYVIMVEVAREEMVSLEMKDYVKSDHQPLVVKLRRW